MIELTDEQRAFLGKLKEGDYVKHDEAQRELLFSLHGPGFIMPVAGLYLQSDSDVVIDGHTAIKLTGLYRVTKLADDARKPKGGPEGPEAAKPDRPDAVGTVTPKTMGGA